MALGVTTCVECKLFVATCVILKQEVCSECAQLILMADIQSKEVRVNDQSDINKDNSGVV